MESKIVILIVCASLVQGSSVPILAVSYGLSENQVSEVNEIILNQEKVVDIYYNMVNDLFDILLNLKSKTGEDCSKVFQILMRLTAAFDLGFESGLIALGKSCPGIELARQEAYDYLNDVASQVKGGCELARSGKYSKNRNAIEERRAAAQEDLRVLINSFYNFITTCLDSKEADVLAVIENFRNGSLLTTRIINAIFNAIKLRAAAGCHTKCRDRKFASNMEDFKNDVLNEAMTNTENEFSLMRTLYMYSKLNKSEIVTELASNQQALVVSWNRWRVGNEIVFRTILRYIVKIKLGLNDDGRLDYSLDDLDVAKIIAYYNAGDASNLNSILVLHPESAAAIAVARERIFAVNVLGSTIHLSAIQEIFAKVFSFSEIVNRLKALSDGVDALAPSYTGDYLSVIRNNRIFNAEQEAGLKGLQEQMINATVYATNRFLDMVLILVNATYSGKVREDDCSSLKTLLDASNSGTAKYGQAISAAGILVMMADDTS